MSPVIRERLLCRPRSDRRRNEPRPGNAEPRLYERRAPPLNATGVRTQSTISYNSPSIDTSSLSTRPNVLTDGVKGPGHADRVGRRPSVSSGVSARIISLQSTDTPEIPGSV